MNDPFKVFHSNKAYIHEAYIHKAYIYIDNYNRKVLRTTAPKSHELQEEEMWTQLRFESEEEAEINVSLVFY